jgi:hypothetical protein
MPTDAIQQWETPEKAKYVIPDASAPPCIAMPVATKEEMHFVALIEVGVTCVSPIGNFTVFFFDGHGELTVSQQAYATAAENFALLPVSDEHKSLVFCRGI